jgi:DNA-binding response OmpR family regulator
MKILYIENHQKFSTLISRHLLSEYSVVVVPSIAQASLKISADVFDLVLLDYDLDDGKGSEIIPLLKNLPNQPKIIAVSAHEEGNNILLAAGADAVCYKRDISGIGGVIKSLS